MTQGIEHVEPPLDSGRVQVLVIVLASIALIFAIAILAESPWPADSQSHTPVAIDVNTASPRELAILPGVGPVLAKRIAENRDRNGRFAATEDIRRVHGVGQKTMEQIRSYATVRSAAVRSDEDQSDDVPSMAVQRDGRVGSASSNDDSFDQPSR